MALCTKCGRPSYTIAGTECSLCREVKIPASLKPPITSFCEACAKPYELTESHLNGDLCPACDKPVINPIPAPEDGHGLAESIAQHATGMVMPGTVPSRKAQEYLEEEVDDRLERIRTKLWCDVAVAAVRHGRFGQDVLAIADGVVRGFDKRKA